MYPPPRISRWSGTLSSSIMDVESRAGTSSRPEIRGETGREPVLMKICSPFRRRTVSPSTLTSISRRPENTASPRMSSSPSVDSILLSLPDRNSSTMARKRAIVEEFRSGSESKIESTEGLELIRGEAVFSGLREMEVRVEGETVRRLKGEQIFINAGSRPVSPRISGLEDVPALDSTSIMELDKVPDHLLILGGGYIGVEFGQMFRRYGAAVTIIQRGYQLLSREDEDVAKAVAGVLAEDGIRLLFGVETTHAARTDGGVALTIRRGEEESILRGSHLLVATGRVPETDGLALEEAGVEVDEKGFVLVNNGLETSASGIYALGDVKPGPAFTHISYDDFRILRTRLLEGEEAGLEGRMIAYTVFMDPQLGVVGMTEKVARRAGRDYLVARIPMNWVARALEMDESRGMMKALVDRSSGSILGAAILGVEGGELMSLLQVAMMGDLPYTALRDGVFAHPTLAEAMNTLFSRLEEPGPQL